ncbi:amidohydrolase [Dyadobacter psychrotolerans]|uniref:Amidohydrolase n=1 Tax=Dyadobacter psychrotolerans TaxID=2541721 RepID=A0A4R5DM79_9BACT|nr:amidohydrolase [Dyadobacter psychrotolerans]TDE11995.1 amidohydrolase [Dyadobacter psychrotolerans]
MKRNKLGVSILMCLSVFTLEAQTTFNKEQKEVIGGLEAKKDHYAEISKKIWDLAEVGYQEYKSSEILQEELKREGFAVEKGVAGIPTAFVATYGSGKPVISILAEFDALPGMAQEAVADRKVIEGQKAGHACGHHLFGTGSSAAAIAVKDWLKKGGKTGTIKLMGCPAEEGGSGKVYMVREGVFKDSDIVLHWHPADRNGANPSSSLANISGKFRFTGIAAHAAGAPERGRSALDGVEAMNNMVNMMREHVPQETRIHYVITRGGEAPNVVPAFAEVYYYARHPNREVVRDVWSRMVKAAEGAAMGTGTKVELEVTGGAYDLLPIESLARAMHKNLDVVGGLKYSPEEIAFAEKLIPSLVVPGKMSPLYSMAEKVAPFSTDPESMGGSTDVGDVSWAVPTVGLAAATWVPGTPAHSWQAVAAGGMTIGPKGMMVAAKTLALTAIDLFKDPALIKTAQADWLKARGQNFKYEAMVGNRKPALDYRK